MSRLLLPFKKSGGSGYDARVLATSPTFLFMLEEPSGTAMVCSVNSAQNGTYAAGVTPGAGATSPGATLTPLFAGTRYSYGVTTYAPLLAAFDMIGPFTWQIWWKAGLATDWTDGRRKFSGAMWRASGTRHNFEIGTVANEIRQSYRMGHSEDNNTQGSMAGTMDWHCYQGHIDEVGTDSMRAWLDGVETADSPQLGLATGIAIPFEILAGNRAADYDNYGWSGSLWAFAGWANTLVPEATLQELAVV